MKKLLATAALLLTATAASAQEACLNEAEMTALMAESGYVPFIGGLSEETATSFWFYVNPFDGTWMIHTVDLSSDMECHIIGGEEYFVPGSGA